MKRIIIVLFFLVLGLCSKAQNAEIICRESSDFKCFVTHYDKDNVYYTLENDDKTHSIPKSEVEKILFRYSSMTFTEDGEIKFRANFLPGSKWKASTVDYGKFTLHGKPYKGPVCIHTILDLYFAGSTWSELQGLLVPIE